MRFAASFAFAALAMTAPASAVVINTLPTVVPGDWSRGSFDSYSAATVGGETALQTAPVRGVYFGYQTAIGAPAWTPGGSADGNYLSLTARFGQANVASYGGPADWSAYFDDASHHVAMLFAPTDCNSNQESCYPYPGKAGVNIYFADPLNAGNSVAQFVALDPTVNHTYEFLLKNGQVSYRIDGRVYSGAAQNSVYNYKLLIIGDGSGSSYSGAGSMTISNVLFDTAPTLDALPGLVPEPATWALMIGGFGLIGASARRRRSVAVNA